MVECGAAGRSAARVVGGSLLEEGGHSLALAFGSEGDQADSLGLLGIDHPAREDLGLGLADRSDQALRVASTAQDPDRDLGLPNLALLAATMRSHIMASSAPPPSA